MRSTAACSCHGVDKVWHKDGRRRSGGYWRCRIRWLQALERANAKRAWPQALYNHRRRAASREQRLKELNGT